jgi:hypothetical protein
VSAKRSNEHTCDLKHNKVVSQVECYPTALKSADDAVEALQNFVGPRDVVSLLHTDCSGESKAAAKKLGWRHSTSTQGRPETNGVAERTVRYVLEGSRTVLEQSGLHIKWWSRAVRHVCMMHNTQHRGADGKTPRERRFGGPFGGPAIPFGSLVQYLLALDKANDKERKFDTSALPGIMLGYHMNPGGKWSKDIYVWTWRPWQKTKMVAISALAGSERVAIPFGLRRSSWTKPHQKSRQETRRLHRHRHPPVLTSGGNPRLR